MLFGVHLAILNGPLDAIAAALGFGSDANAKGLVVSVALIGAAVGSTVGSSVADSLGRKKGLLVTCVPLIAGSLVLAKAASLTSLLVGRVLVGAGIGLASALVPLYISEIAPQEIRGALGSVNQLTINVGILAALVANILIPPSDWRRLFLLTAGPAVLLFLGMLTQPESPRWLSQKGRQQEAQQAAAALWGPEGPSQLTGSTSTGTESAPKVGLGQLLSTRGAQIGVVLFLLQQFSGINAVIYFSSKVFAEAGIQNAALASAAVGLTNVVGTIIAGSIIEKAGRKQLLNISFAGMGVSLAALAAGAYFPQLAGHASTIAFAGVLAYIASFALGVGPIPGTLVPEVNSEKLRGRAVSLAMTVHWVANFMVGQFFQPALQAVGQVGVYTSFALVCAIAVIVCKSAFIPETKGKSLAEIEAELAFN
jgi:sugar porter (SP) family MFS transporter